MNNIQPGIYPCFVILARQNNFFTPMSSLNVEVSVWKRKYKLIEKIDMDYHVLKGFTLNSPQNQAAVDKISSFLNNK